MTVQNFPGYNVLGLAINLILHTVFVGIRHGPAGEHLLLRLSCAFPAACEPFPVLLLDLLAEEAVHQEDEGC